MSSAVVSTYRIATGAELRGLPVALAVQGARNLHPAKSTATEDAFDTKILFDYWRAQPESAALPFAALTTKCISLLLADTAGRPGDLACLDPAKTVFRRGAGWGDALEVAISMYHPKEYWYGDGHRSGEHSKPVPIRRIRQTMVRDGAKIDTFEAMAALERKIAALQPQPCYKLAPSAANGEGGAPGAFPMQRAMAEGHAPIRYSIGRDRVGSIMRGFWSKALGQSSRAYILRGSVESIWFELGVPVHQIVQRSRHKESTFHEHYKRRVPDRILEAVNTHRQRSNLSLEEMIRQ